MPMPRSLGSSQVTFLPLMKIWPSVMSSRPAMQLSSVDLPQPDGPSSTMNSPSAMSRLSLLSTFTLPKARCRSLTATDGWTLSSGSCAYPFTAPAAMPRTKSLPEMK